MQMSMASQNNMDAHQKHTDALIEKLKVHVRYIEKHHTYQ